MLADITSVSRDIGSLARSRGMRILVSDPDRMSSAWSKDGLNNRLLTNITNIRRDVEAHELPLIMRSQRPNINK